MAVASPDIPGITILTGDLAAAGTVSLPAPALALRFSPDGAGLYAALAMDSGVTVLSLAGPAGGEWKALPRLSGSAVEVIFARDSRTLYVALDGGESGGGVSFLDVATLRQRRRLAVCDPVRAAGVTGDAERLYLLCGSDRIAEIDTGLEIVIRVQQLGAPCDAPALAVSRTDAAILVPCPLRGQVWYLDRRTLTPFDSLAVPGRVQSIAVTPDRRRVLLALPAERRVLVVDPTRRTMVAAVELPSPPTDLVAAGNVAYVLAGALVVALDWERGAITRTSIPGTAHTLAAWPGTREPRMRWHAR